ncbi:MAG: anti-sigma factor [Paenirhodobacter sp.]|uniref:anti-sigma factor family protein n=1 Tax=Paenirhodobacter sp. TaxID=1965326 RepID=UPI003D12765A
MSGNFSQAEIQAFLDDRLAPERRAALEAHLAADPDLRAVLDAQAADLAALRAALAPKAAEPVPDRLSLTALEAGLARRQGAGLRRIAAGVLIFALGLGAGLGLAPRGAAPAAGEARLTNEAQLAYAVYSVEVAHPVEVSAAEQDHLMAWLSKRLGRKLIAPDLSAQGFALMGGRLLPADSGPAAQLMYEDASGRRATLYIAAVAGKESAFRFAEGPDGVSSLTWLDGGYGCAISAPMGRAALWPLAEAAYRALSL